MAVELNFPSRVSAIEIWIEIPLQHIVCLFVAQLRRTCVFYSIQDFPALSDTLLDIL